MNLAPVIMSSTDLFILEVKFWIPIYFRKLIESSFKFFNNTAVPFMHKLNTNWS